jgi:hypothetical protein
MLQILSCFNQKQRAGFFSILDRQVKTIHSFSLFIDQCIKANGKSDETLDKIIQFICAKISDPKKAEAALKKIAAINEPRLYKIISGIMDHSNDIKTISKYNVICNLKL